MLLSDLIATPLTYVLPSIDRRNKSPTFVPAPTPLSNMIQLSTGARCSPDPMRLDVPLKLRMVPCH